MYYDYFGLNQPPFRITPDTSLFFPGGDRGAILNAMIYAITSGEGIVKVVGEVGSGKTMLCRMLAVELPANVEVVYLANPNLSPDDILRAIAFELKLAVASQDDRLRVMQSLQQYLLKRHAENRQIVIFVEEAQSMPLVTLEEIRLLSNLETRQHKLLQIVLFGQPELDQMISRREIRQLKERITYSFYLKPLKNHEIRDYLSTRLRACGYRGGEVFNASAIREIGRYSKGLLRRINILADKALLASYAANQHKVTARQVRAAAQDSEFVATWQHARRVVVASGVAGLALLILWFVPYQQFFQNHNQSTELQQESSNHRNEAGSVAPFTATPESADVPSHSEKQEESTIYHLQHEPGPGFSATVDISAPALAELLTPSMQPDNNDEVTTKMALHDGTDAYDSAAGNAGIRPQNDLADSLLDQVDYAQYVDREASLLTGEEVDIMLQQLKALPPETIDYPGAETKCNKCVSIIYRPLVKTESL